MVLRVSLFLHVLQNAFAKASHINKGIAVLLEHKMHSSVFATSTHYRMSSVKTHEDAISVCLIAEFPSIKTY